MKIGYAFCGSFCTFSKSFEQLSALRNAEHEIVPIMSFNAASIDTRFGKAADFIANAESICERHVIRTIEDAEPLGPREPLDLLIISPCTGNTLAKMALGVTDTPVTMAAKAHLRSDRPLVIALATNDALSANLGNISTLLRRKSVFFVPLEQDEPNVKPHSLVCRFDLLAQTVACALRGEQIRPFVI